MGKKHLHILSFVLAFAVTLSCFTPAQYATAKNKIESFTPLSDSEQSDGSIAPVKTTSDAITLSDNNDSYEYTSTVTTPDLLTLPYSNDFSDDTSLSDWDTSLSTQFKLKDGKLSATAPPKNGSYITTLLPTGDYNYTVESDVTISGTGAGLVFGYVDSQNNYYFRLDCGDGFRVQLYCWEDGALSKPGNIPFAWESEQTYRLKAEVTENKIVCYVDDTAVFECPTTKRVTGKVGVRFYGNTAIFDNFSMKDPAIANEISLPYSNDFSNDEDFLSAWDTGMSPYFEVQDGELVATAPTTVGSYVATKLPTGYYDYAVEADVTISEGATGAGLIFGYVDGQNQYYFRLDCGGNGDYRAQLYCWEDGVLSKPGNVLFAWVPGITYRLKAEVTRNKITCYVDDTVVCECPTAERVTGRVGVRFYGGTAAFDNFSVKTPEGPPPLTPGDFTLPYTNDFANGDALGGWKSVNGNFAVANGKLSGSGSSLIAADKLVGANCIIETEISFPTKSSAVAGLVFRYQDSGNFYLFRLSSASSGQAHLYRWKDGKSTQVDLKGNWWQPNRVYRLKVVADGGLFKCYINDELIFTYEDPDPILSGGVGFHSSGSTTASFDNLSVTTLEAPIVTLDKPLEGSISEELPVIISGDTEAAYSAKLDVKKAEGDEYILRDVTLPLANDGSFTYQAYLPNGAYIATATAYRYDEALNANDSRAFSVGLSELPALSAALDKTVNVPVTGPVLVKFSLPVNETTINGNIQLKQDDEIINSTLSFSGDDRYGCTVAIVPDVPLTEGAEYAVVIGEGVRDVLGQSIGSAPVYLRFTATNAGALLPIGGDEGQVVLSLNGDWAFQIDPEEKGVLESWYSKTNFTGWDTLSVPGNWDLENEYAGYKGAAWLARDFSVSDQYAGYPVYLELSYLYYDCTVWINGCKVGSHKGGYTTFEFRVDQCLNFGVENTIVVLTNNDSYKQPGDWNDGAWWKWGGISGDALLRVHNAAKFDWQHITPTVTDLDKKNATIDFEYKLDNLTNAGKTYTIVSEVYDKTTGELVGKAENPSITLNPGTNQVTGVSLALTGVKLWHIDSPNLYTVKTRLMDGDQIIHYAEDNIGFRKLEWTEKQFLLNGEPLRLTGANRIGDDRAHGHTEPDYVIMRDIDYMKSMGMGAARISHVPMTKNALNYCDEIGFLLICEGGMWGDPPEMVDGEYVCVPWYDEMVNRDYNHPAIFAWSIGNEMNGGLQATKDYAQFMMNHLHEMDPTRPAIEVSNSGAGNANDSLQFSTTFGGYNNYGANTTFPSSLFNTFHKPFFMTEVGYSQMSENPDSSALNAQGLVNCYSQESAAHIFGISIWTLNDYRSHLFNTPVSENRPWGVTTVWGTKKRAFDSLRKAFSLVDSLTVEVIKGDNPFALIGMKIKSAYGIPSYPLRNAKLKWEAVNRDGKVLISELKDLPELQPGADTQYSTTVLRDLEGKIAYIRATVIDSPGYEIAETVRYMEAPSSPKIVGTVAAKDSIRVYFEGSDNAESYVVTADNGQSRTVYLNRYADFTGLAGGEYTFTIAARNNAGSSNASNAVTTSTNADFDILPPVVWHTEPVKNAFFVGYSVVSDSNSYDIRYRAEDEEYSGVQLNGLTTQGAAKVSDLDGGKIYYYQIRVISDGRASDWSQEIAVAPESEDYILDAPVLKGAAANENTVSLTIDPVWKATGYTVRYKPVAGGPTHELFIHRAQVEQLTISGLEDGVTYEFTVAAHNENGMGDFSAPLSVTAGDSHSEDVFTAAVEPGTLRFPLSSLTRSTEVSAYNSGSDNRPVTVKLEGVPEGVDVMLDGRPIADENTAFMAEAGILTEKLLSFTVGESAVSGRHVVRVSLWNGETKLSEAEIILNILNSTVLFRDDFDTYNGAGYTTPDPVPTVENGRLMLPSSSGGYLMNVKDKNWSNYVVESDLMASANANTGIVLHYRDNNNFYHVRISGTSSLQVYQWKDGKSTQLKNISIPTDEDGIYRLRANVSGQGADIYLDDMFMASIDLDWAQGTVGYRTYAAAAAVENLYVYQLPNIPVTGITLNRSEAVLYTDHDTKSIQLTATVEPEDATNKKVTWSSSNSDVVTVDAIGVGIAEVTAISEGTAAITVTTEDGRYEDTCEVTVTTEAPVQYSIAVEDIANGVVTADMAVAAEGDEVTLTVAPDSNYRLAEDSLKVYKTGDPDTTVPVNGNKFTMPGYNVTVTARFEKIPGQGTYTLTISAGTGGSIREGESGNYAAGTVVSIAAAAKRGYRFRGWTTNAGGTFGNSNSASTTFVMPENDVVVTAVFTRIKDDDDNKPEPKIDVIREDTTQTVSTGVKPVNDTAAGTSYARIDSGTVAALVHKANEVKSPDERSIIEIRVEPQENAQKVEVDFPRAAFRKLAEDTEADLRVSTGVGNITFDRRALAAINDAAPSGDVRITIDKVEKSSLPSDVRSIAGDRPVYHLAVEAGDSSVSSFGGGTAFVSLPYTPGTGEDEDCIVVYYLDDAGELKPARGRYDRQTGMVSFTTRHFSNFMIGYNKVTFHDVDKNEWYRRAVGFTAARGVIKGRGDGSFAPTENVTRADFLIMLMNAYGIEPDEVTADNFVDAGNKYYTRYLGAAKRMGIAAGVGENKYLPESTISRQDMFVLLYRALETLGELPEGSGGRKLESFDDGKDVAAYAKDAIRFFAEAGIVNGSGTSLAPKATSTRAQAAQILYNLLSK